MAELTDERIEAELSVDLKAHIVNAYNVSDAPESVPLAQTTLN